MSISSIVIAAVIVGGTGVLLGFFLGFSDKAFHVDVDPREEAIAEALPGNNCGGCGFAGCSALASAIAKGNAKIGQCPVGGEPVAARIAEIMGKAVSFEERKVAYVKCAGNCNHTTEIYDYRGDRTCSSAASMQNGGSKSCSVGCLGFGDCVKACEFDAIHIVDGISRVDEEKCKACGMCVKACPKHLIELIPAGKPYHVQCSNKGRGKEVMTVCKVGCIGCKACEKVCENEAITVVDNVAHIDYEKCIGCGKCAEKCPRHIIS